MTSAIESDTVTTTPTTPTSPATNAGEGTSLVTQSESVLVTSQGRTTIAETVVVKVAGIAAREIDGVHKLGGTAARAFGAVRERIPGQKQSLAQGVSVEVGERQAAVDLDVMVEYGVEIAELTKAIRRNVTVAIETMTGLEVTEININIGDVFIPGTDDDADESSGSRVL